VPIVASFLTESPVPKVFKFGFIVRFVLYSDITEILIVPTTPLEM
jgi:hypothetical protein